MNIKREAKQEQIEINGVVYKIPLRTQKIQDELIGVEKNRELTEFERYFKTVSAIMGEDVADEIFSLGQDESLDYMNRVVVEIGKLYNSAVKKQRDATINEINNLTKSVKINELDKMVELANKKGI